MIVHRGGEKYTSLVSQTHPGFAVKGRLGGACTLSPKVLPKPFVHPCPTKQDILIKM